MADDERAGLLENEEGEEDDDDLFQIMVHEG